MDNIPESEVVHLKAEQNLPAVPMALPAAEVLKQILEKMLENERRRARNEFIRIGSIFLLLLLVIMAGGFWLARDILNQVKEARVMSEHSQEALVTLLAAVNRRAPAAARLQPATPGDNSSGIQQSISDLENKNRTLAELMQTQAGEYKSLVQDVQKTRDNQIRDVYARVNSRQADAMAAESPELDEIADTKPAEKAQPPAIKVTLPDQPPVKSLTASASADLTLRLPIPAP